MSVQQKWILTGVLGGLLLLLFPPSPERGVKEARDKRIFHLWLACWTIEEIAEREGMSKAQVSEICSESAELPESNKPTALHQVDFDPPLYNVWKQQDKTSKKENP